MTNENSQGRVGEDLAYVRAVVERQRELLCEHVPVWFAALIGLWLVCTMSLRDLVDHGMVAENIQEWVGNSGLFIVVAILLWRAAQQRRNRKPSDRPRFARQEISRIVLPWFAFMAGLILFRQLGGAAGLDKDVLRPFMFAYTAMALTIIGFSSLHTVLGFGLGLAVGTIAFAFFGLSYPFTALGVAAWLGIVLGAYADQRRVRGA